MVQSLNTRERIFQQFIAGQQASVGGRIPTIRELAARFGVSSPTAGRAVQMLTSEGWLTKRQGSGIYIAAVPGDAPHRPTQADAAGRRGTVGYIAVNLESTLANRVLEGLEAEVTRDNRALHVASSRGLIEQEQQQIERMIADGVDGIVLFPTPRTPGAAEYLAEQYRQVPMVVVDMYQPAMNRPSVIFDNYLAGREMTRYLLQQGHQRIGFVTFDSGVTYRSLDDRLAGYRRELADAGLAPSDELLVNAGRPGRINTTALARCNGLQHALDQLAAAGATAAIFPCDDVIEQAIHGTDLLARHERGALEFVGFDNLQVTPGVSWVSTGPDFVRMGEMAGHMLMNQTDPSAAQRILPCPLVNASSPTPSRFLSAVGPRSQALATGQLSAS
jgi:DNA-binding LacI/PurR family transcriptional regulator